VIGKIEVLGVEHPVLDVGQAELVPVPASGIHHRLGEIAHEDASLSPEAERNGEPDDACTCGQLENRGAGPRREALDQALRDRSSHALHVGVSLVPASRDRPPDRAAGALVLTRVHNGVR
jgi:hypothetical protein